MFYIETLKTIENGLINHKTKIIQYRNETREEIEKINKKIDENDNNARQHWENQKNLINEITAKQNMLVEAFNEQRIIIAKLVAKINKKAVKTTKKGK